MSNDIKQIETTKNLHNNFIYDYTNCSVDILKEETEYSKFYEDYIYKNLPCVIKNISTLWECTSKWIKCDTINYDYLIEKFSDMDAPVADCGSITYNAQSKLDSKVIDYVNYLKSVKREKLLYLKDWHLRRLRPDDNFYEVPTLFGSDWLNEYAQDHHEDDFIFVYIGPKDSWTPLHADVYSSFSWSVNVVGRKKWILFPPEEEEKMKDSLGNLPLLFSENNFKDIKHFEVIQEKGDAIFVPSGWHHQVINQLDTISINHNWINACNIEEVWKALVKCLISVEHEIKEYRDTSEFVDQCQLILKSMFGMDFQSFINFISYIAKKRLSQFQGHNYIVFNKFALGINHIVFDLKALMKVIHLFDNHPLIVNKCIKINYKYDHLSIKKTIADIVK